MEDRKYIITDAMKKVNSHILHRVKAVKDFGDIKAGDLGGFIEKEENLSHEGLCWVNGEACVYENAIVFENALISGNARVFEHAWVSGNARVSEKALIYGNAQIWGHTTVCGNARVCGDANVHGYAKICGYAAVYERARIFGDAQVYGDAQICGDAQIYGNAIVRGYTWIEDREKIYTGDLSRKRSSLCLGPIGSRDDHTTFFLSDNKIMVTCGCFKGDISEFERAVHKTHAGTRHEEDYIAAIQFAKIFFKQ